MEERKQLWAKPLGNPMSAERQMADLTGPPQSGELCQFFQKSGWCKFATCALVFGDLFCLGVHLLGDPAAVPR